VIGPFSQRIQWAIDHAQQLDGLGVIEHDKRQRTYARMYMSPPECGNRFRCRCGSRVFSVPEGIRLPLLE
jgi:hypothetical protein